MCVSVYEREQTNKCTRSASIQATIVDSTPALPFSSVVGEGTVYLSINLIPITQSERRVLSVGAILLHHNIQNTGSTGSVEACRRIRDDLNFFNG